jgi:hypothetical protein
MPWYHLTLPDDPVLQTFLYNAFAPAVVATPKMR